MARPKAKDLWQVSGGTKAFQETKTVDKSVPLLDVDVTYDELVNLRKLNSILPILDFLKKSWVGKCRKRAYDTRIGSAKVFFDDDGHLHIDFQTRFAVNLSLISKQATPKQKKAYPSRVVHTQRTGRKIREEIERLSQDKRGPFLYSRS